METTKKPKKRASWVIPLVATVVFSVVATFLINLWLNGDTTYISAEDNAESISYLACSTNDLEEPFFAPANSVSVEHRVKVTFGDDRPSDATYEFRGVFESGDWANQADASMHAQYNIRMGELGIDAGTFTPVFEHAGNNVHVNLYADKNEITGPVASLFALAADEAVRFYTYSSEQLSQIYSDKGFSCVLTK